MVKTQQEIYAEKYRAGTLTDAERNTLLNAWKTLWEEATRQKLMGTQPNPATPTPIQPMQTAPQTVLDYQKNPTAQPVQENIDALNKQNAQDPKIETQKSTEALNPITKDTTWNQVPEKNITNLEQLVEARYGTVATQKDGKLTAQVWDKNYEWALDQQGNPVKTEVQQTPADLVKNKLFQKYNTASSDELFNALNTNSIPDDLKTDLMMNPNYAIAQEKFQKKKSADQTNELVGNMYKTSTGAEIEQKDYATQLGEQIGADKLAKGYTEPQLTSYKDFIAQDTELTGNIKELDAKTTQLNELNRLAEGNLKTITSSYPWITQGAAMLLNARQSAPVYEQISALSDEIGILQANVKYRESILDKDWEEVQQQEDRRYNESVMQEQRVYDEAQATKTLEQNYAYQNGDLNSENPTLQNIAIERAVAGMYENYPIPWMESQATKVQKVKQLMVGGMSGTEAIAQVESEIRNSQRYKDYIASEKNKLTTTEKPFVVSEWSSVYDPISKTWSTAPTQKSAEVMQLQEWYVGGECGTFARQYTGISTWLDSVVWKTASDRRKTMTEKQPVEWWLAFFEWGDYNKEYGHIEVVKSINADRTMTLVWSNLNNDKKVTERTIPITQAKGFYNNTPLATGKEWIEWDKYTKILSTKLIAGASRLSDDERKFQLEEMQKAIQQWDTTYANEILRWVILNDKRQWEKIYDNIELKSWLGNLKWILADFKASGGNTGIIRNMAERTANYLGTTTDVELAKAKNQLWVLVADYIRSISGTAASDTEVARLLENMPNIKNIDSFNTSLLDNLQDIANRRVKSNIDTFLWNYKDIAPTLFPEFYTTPTQTTTPEQVNYKWYSLPK